MQKRCLILLALIACYAGASSQLPANTIKLIRQRIVEVQSKLTTASGIAKVDLLLQLAGHYVDINDDTVLVLLDQSEKLANQIKYDSGAIKSIQMKGSFYETQHKNYVNALSYYNRAMVYAKSKQYYAFIQELYTNHLNLYFYNGEFINAMQTASEALNLAEQKNDRARMAQLYNVIGFIHLRQNNADEAERYYRQFLLYANKANDSTTIGDALVCLGEASLLKKECNKALTFFQQAETVYSKLNSRGKLYKRDRIPHILFKKSSAYHCSGNIEDALQYANSALDASGRTPCNKYDIAQYNIFAGSLFMNRNDFSRAYKLLRIGLAISTQINHKENTRDAYLHFHQLFAKQKRYDSAYHYYSLYGELKDSILNETTRKKIDQADANYQLEKKNNEIKLLSQQKKLQEEQTSQQTLVRNLVAIFAILVIVTVLFIANRNHLKRKNRLQKEINEKQAEVFNQIASIQDNERKRIAQDLHDGMGTILSAAKLRLSSIPQHITVSDTLQLIDDASTELRNISHNLMPATLSKLGLTAALQNLAERLSSKNIHIHLITHGIDERLQEEMEIFTYRIISELMNNVTKHSRADEATIQVIRYPDRINITVEDNGSGFDTTQEYQGIGLTNIRSRVEYLKGSVHIDSGPGKGTTVAIDIPC